MAIEDDDKPRKKITHEIGQDLSLLSVEELTERIALMNSEIERLQAAMTKKRASKDAANSFFKIVRFEPVSRTRAVACGAAPQTPRPIFGRPLADCRATRSQVAMRLRRVRDASEKSHTRPMADMANEA